MPTWKLINLDERRHKPGLLINMRPKLGSSGAFSAAEDVYCIINDQGNVVVRGQHYHPVGTKAEFLICLSGKAVVELHSQNGCGVESLSSPSVALYIPSGVWHGVSLTPGSILLSVANLEEKPGFLALPKPCGHHK